MTFAIASNEIATRRPVWIAFSELFLDRELDEADLQRIGAELARSAFTLPELKKILFREVLPVLWTNGASPAGVWTAFDPDWLAEEIVHRSARRLRWPSALLPRTMVREPWARLREIVDELRSAPD